MKIEIEIASQNLFRQSAAAKKILSEEITATLNKGIQSAKDGDRAEARRLLAIVTEADSENEAAWLWLASISEYPEELLAFLRQVLKINPHNARALEWSAATKSLLANTLVQHGTNALLADRADFARGCFLQAVANDSRNETARLQLAFLAESPDEKIACLEQVLNINPHHEAALSALEQHRRESLQSLLKKANFAAISGERETALQLLEEAAQAAPDLEEVWMLKAYLADESQKKIECYEKVLRSNPDNEAAQAGLSSIRAIIQKADEQKSFAETLKDVLEAEKFSDEDFRSEKFAKTDSAEQPVAVEEAKESFSETDISQIASEEQHASEDFAGDIEILPDFFDEAQIEFPTNVEESPEVFSDEEEFLLPEIPENPAPLEEENFAVITLNQTTATFNCPFCDATSETQAIICASCRTLLSLADLETLLAYQEANAEVLRPAIENMEAARTTRAFDAEKLTNLAIAYLNAKNLRAGLNCLREAAQLTPNDIGLISKINFLAIRLAEIEEQNSSKAAKHQFRKCTIMIVDDNPTIRKLVSGKLEKCGHTVIPATGGRDALEKINEVTPDLILLDAAMPEMDGYQVCEIIRSTEETKNVPVLLISGKDEIFDQSRGQTVGSNGFMVKPFGPETLMRTIETYIS
ncbi:MAG: response regulator [Pyrinomonadaceae bacterium]